MTKSVSSVRLLLLAGTLISQSGSALGGVALAIVVGALVGADGLGQLTIVLTLASFFELIAMRGQNSLIMRAAAWAEFRYNRLASRALFLGSLRLVVLPSAILGGAGSCLIASGLLGASFANAVYLFPALLAPMVALSVFAGYLRGTSRVWMAPLFSMGSVSLVAVICIIVFNDGSPAFPSSWTMPILVFSAVGVAAVGGVIVFREAPTPLYRPRFLKRFDAELTQGRNAFAIIALGSFLIQAGGFVVAAPFLDEGEIGVLRAAERLAVLIGFPVLAINPLIVSSIVPAFRTGDRQALNRNVLFAVIMIFFTSVPIAAVLLLFPEFILTQIGPEFASAAGFLQQMAAAQLLAALVGPFALLLTMTDREKVSMYVHLTVLLFALVAFPALCANYGSTGFVYAYVAATALRFLLIALAIAHSQHLGLLKSQAER